MADNNDSLFREVDEELRREQFAKIWERYGIYLIGLAVLIIVLVGGAKIWQAQRLANAQAFGAKYEEAIALENETKLGDAAKAFEAIAADAPKGYAALAALSQSGTELRLGNRPKALEIFERLAASSSTDSELANFARLQAAALRLGEADFTEMENRLKPLTSDDSAWRLPARELLGTAALKAGKLDEARTTLSSLLGEPGLSQTAIERINRLMATITSAGLSAAPAPAATAAPAATPAPATTPPAPAQKDADKPASTP
jgi:hypothetical protein